MRQSNSESHYQHKASPLRSPTLPPTGQLPHTQLLPRSTEKLYISLSAPIEDVNMAIVRQGYNVIKKEGNRKEKNGDLRRNCLRCSKGGSYKAEGNFMKHGTRGRRRQRTNCPWYENWNRTTANDCTDMESRLRGAEGLTSRSIRLFSPTHYILSSRPIPIHSISCRVNRPCPCARYSFGKIIRNMYNTALFIVFLQR